MPRKNTSRASASAFQQVQQQARTLLLNLRKDIRLKESVLSKLKQEEARLGSLIGGGSRAAKSVSSGPRGRAVGDFCGNHAMDRCGRCKTESPRSLRKSLV
jgi:hypothetical protein